MGSKRALLGQLAFLMALLSVLLAVVLWWQISRLRRDVLTLFRGIRATTGR